MGQVLHGSATTADLPTGPKDPRSTSLSIEEEEEEEDEAGSDQRLTVAPGRPLQFPYQGVDPAADGRDYLHLPYHLGLLTATGPNPISAMCRRR